jgi:hypothetical protein
MVRPHEFTFVKRNKEIEETKVRCVCHRHNVGCFVEEKGKETPEDGITQSQKCLVTSALAHWICTEKRKQQTRSITLYGGLDPDGGRRL